MKELYNIELLNKMAPVYSWMILLCVMRGWASSEAQDSSVSRNIVDGSASVCTHDGIQLPIVQLALHLSNFVYEKADIEHDQTIANHIYIRHSSWNIEASFGEVAGRIWLFDDRTLFVVFRGTASLTDAFMNSQFYRQEAFYKMGKVHSGFISRLRRMNRRVDSIIESNTPHFDRIVFAGHSLGGAVAMLAALKYSLNNRGAQVDVVTFGSPRVGNHTFGKYFNFYIKSHTRVVVDQDPVVKLPPRFLGYEHIQGGCVVILTDHSHRSGIFNLFEAHRLVIYQTQLQLLSQ